jgi:hypothetical protein
MSSGPRLSFVFQSQPDPDGGEGEYRVPMAGHLAAASP